MSNIIRIPGTDKFMDIDTLEIYNNEKCDINLTKMLKINDKMALIEVAGVPVRKPLEWFKHLAILGLKLPEQFKYEINNIEFKDYNPFGVSKDYNKMPVFKESVAFNIDSIDYRLIARYPTYGISKDGVIYSLITNAKLSPLKNSMFDYKHYMLRDTYRKKTQVAFIHKLVAMAWCFNKDYVKYNIVDHKDDNKLNNNYTNLNWTSNSGNQAKFTHGNYKTNILVRDINTNQVKEFSSLTLAAEYMGRSRINTQHTPLTMGRIWTGANGEYELQYKSEFKNWTKDIRALQDRRIVVTDANGKHTFKNMSEIKKYYELPKRLSSFREVTDRLKKRNIEIKIDVHIGSRDPKNLEAKNVITKEIVTADNISKLGRAINVPNSTMQKYIDKGIDNVLAGDWLVRTRTNLPWADDLGTIKTNKNTRQKIRAKSNNETIEFKSKREAERFFNKDMKTLANIISKGESITLNNITYVLENI